MSEVVEAVETKLVMCIKGGIRRDWMVLPVEDVQGRMCVRVNSLATWLQHMIGGLRYSKGLQAKIKEFVRECSDAYKVVLFPNGVPAPLELASSQEGQGSQEEAASHEDVPVEKKGRSAVMSESDESSEQGGRPRPKKKARSGRHTSLTGEFVNVSIRGSDFTLTVARGPSILFPVHGPFVGRMVQDLFDQNTSMASSREDTTSIQGWDCRELLSPADRGRTSWRPKSGGAASWSIAFNDREGKRRSCRTDLFVSTKGFSGEALSHEAFRSNAELVLLCARKTWNAKDCSDSTRYNAHELTKAN